MPDETIQDKSDIDHPLELTGDQRVDKAMENNVPSGADEIIRKMVVNVSNENINFPTDLRDIQKPKSFNKKKGNKKDKISAHEYRQPVPIQQTEELRTDSIDPVVDNQQVTKEHIQIIPPDDSRTESINQDVENQHVYKGLIRIQPDILEDNRVSKSAETHTGASKGDRSERIQGNLRRSARIPRISAKAFHMLSHHQDLQETSIFREPENICFNNVS